MTCKSCNTRMPTGLRTCPNCGRAGTPSKQAATPSPDDSQSFPLSASTAGDEADIELDQIAESEAAGNGAMARPKPGKRRTPPQRHGQGTAGVAGVTPRPAEIRALVAEQPAAIESGLRVYKESGRAVGEGFTTDVGEIDLLACDDAGGLVAVTVADLDCDKQVVADLLERIGWLRRHLAKSGQGVRGIVLLASIPEDLLYAAAAVSETVAFKTYRVAVTFEDAEF